MLTKYTKETVDEESQPGSKQEDHSLSAQRFREEFKIFFPRDVKFYRSLQTLGTKDAFYSKHRINQRMNLF